MLALLRDQRRAGAGERTAPALSLPLRIKPARACALGWSPDLFTLTLLVGNASLRAEDGALLARGRAPVVAICAEYDRPLTSLSPPALAPYSLARARLQGVPALRLRAAGCGRRSASKPLIGLRSRQRATTMPSPAPDGSSQSWRKPGGAASARCSRSPGPSMGRNTAGRCSTPSRERPCRSCPFDDATRFFCFREPGGPPMHKTIPTLSLAALLACAHEEAAQPSAERDWEKGLAGNP